MQHPRPGNRFSPLVAFQTSGGTSTLPEMFEGRVGESFEKTLAILGTRICVANGKSWAGSRAKE